MSTRGGCVRSPDVNCNDRDQLVDLRSSKVKDSAGFVAKTC